MVQQRQRFTVRGIVQGVGFRPFVYRLAQQLSLSGWVQNDGHDLDIVADIADRVIVLSEGCLVAQGPAQEILNDGDLLRKTRLAHAHWHLHANGEVHAHPHAHRSGHHHPHTPGYRRV